MKWNNDYKQCIKTELVDPLNTEVVQNKKKIGQPKNA